MNVLLDCAYIVLHSVFVHYRTHCTQSNVEQGLVCLSIKLVLTLQLQFI